MIYQLGNTVRLMGTFTDWQGTPTDCDDENVSVTIFNAWGKTVEAGQASPMMNGQYFYDYITTAEGTFIAEFSGTLNTFKTYTRSKFYVLFV